LSFLNELKRRNVLRVGAAYVVSSWLLIQVAETIFPLFGYGDTPARLVVIVLAIAFLPSLILAWVFEITPEGLKRDADVVREQSITEVTGKKLDRIILVVLALALAYFAFDKFVLDPVRDAELVEETEQQIRTDVLVESYGDLSIAVLPFVNMSSDPEQEYFSDGISEELLNLLAKIPEMRVISRSSAFSYKGKDIDIPTIAEQLDVAHVLEGSVRKAGNQIRITAQLIEARSDTHLWSETYDRKLENIFAVQDEISVAIVEALKESLNIQLETTRKTLTATNIEAHDAYLRGRYLVAQRSQDSIEGAILEFEKATALDPGYALAHAELALATLLLPGYGDLTTTEAVARATPHVEQAMALDPNLAEAHAAKGMLLSGQGAYEEELTAYERAIQINPNYSDAYTWKANGLGHIGRYAEEGSLRETALRLDPLSDPAIWNYVRILRQRNRLDDAARELERFASMKPVEYAYLRGELTSVHGNWANMALGCLDAVRFRPATAGYCLPSAFALIGLGQEALAIADSAPSAYTLQVLGRPIDAVATVQKYLIEDPINLRYRRNLALALAASGDYAGARPLLEESWRLSNWRVTLGTTGAFWVDHAAALIAIRREAGEVSGIDELLAAIRDNVRRYREAGITTAGNPAIGGVADYEEGLADLLSGERRGGLTLIAKAAEDGSFILPNEAYLKTLYDDPGFASILAGQEARQTRERNRFLSVVCNNNPYADVWQPAEETCDRFTAEQKIDSPQ
jgi:TolB-like protein